LNIKYGNLHNVHSYNLAIADSNGYVYITDSDSHIENKLVNDDSLQNTRKIESVTIDKFIEDQKIQQIDLLKVNIEGAERELIKCFKNIGIVKNVAISCHDFLGKRLGDPSLYTKDEVITFLEANNFKIKTLNTPNDYANDWVFGTRDSKIMSKDK